VVSPFFGEKMGKHQSNYFEDQITDDKLEKFDEIIAEQKDQPGALIPILHQAQEIFGFLPMEIQEKVAEALEIELSEVYGVVTFYSLFSLQPKGEHEIGVCKGTACYVKGADKILDRLEEELNIQAGETTADGKFSIEVMRCVGACGLGPVVTVDDDIYARVKPEKLSDILSRYN